MGDNGRVGGGGKEPAFNGGRVGSILQGALGKGENSLPIADPINMI